MPESEDIRTAFKRYDSLIEPLLDVPYQLDTSQEGDSSLQVERGVVFPRLLRKPNDFSVDLLEWVRRPIELASSPTLATVAVIDRSIHHRPAYRALLVYSWLQAYRLAYETMPRSQFGRWEEGLRPWCDLLEADLGQIEWPAGSIPADRGASATEAIWTALALQIAGKVYVRDVWLDLASDAFGRLTRAQQPDGRFLLSDASGNPDAQSYHELVLLHAAASYAVQAEDRAVAAAVARNTEYHQAYTQPDHATQQPWGLFAFIWNPSTRPLADQMLHTAAVAQAERTDGVSLMLLADALYSLQLFRI